MVLPPPPPVVAPPRPDLSAERVEEGRGARWIALGVGAALIAFVVVIAVVVSGGAPGDGLPERLDGLDRIHSGLAETLEDQFEGFDMGGVSIAGAIYGPSDDMPLLIVSLIEGPEGELAVVSPDALLDGVAAGFEGSGEGEVDQAASEQAERQGYAVICAPASIAPTAGAPPTSATLCAWKGRAIGIVFDFRTADLMEAVDMTGRIASEVEEGT